MDWYLWKQLGSALVLHVGNEIWRKQRERLKVLVPTLIMPYFARMFRKNNEKDLPVVNHTLVIQQKLQQATEELYTQEEVV